MNRMTSATPPAFPAPRPDQLGKPFWEFASQGLLGLQRCTACGDVHFPPSPVCPQCLSEAQEWIAASGLGTLFSWCRFHRSYWDSVASLLPYTVAMVRLAEGPVLITRLTGVQDLAGLRLGQPVALRFEPTAGDFTLPVFALQEAA